MKTVEKAGYKNSSLSLSISWNNESAPICNGVSDGMGEPVWKSTYEQPYDGYVDDEFSVNNKLKFYNPTPDRPMNGALFLSFLNLGRIRNILQS